MAEKHIHNWEKSYTLKYKGRVDLTEICRECNKFRTREQKEDKPTQKKTITFKQTGYR